jgi:hypothetical protein
VAPSPGGWVLQNFLETLARVDQELAPTY